jgi:RimJ/RimL family protein N-acetyltransferase
MEKTVFKSVILKTERLILRNFVKEDKGSFYKITQDPKIYETLPEDHMYSEEEISEIIDWFIEQYDNNTLENIPKFPLAIVLKDENKIIGNIGIGKYSNDQEKIEIFYFLNSQYWNKRYVTEAVDEFLRYIKDNKLVPSLIGVVVPSNIASKKILTNNGFKKIDHKYNDNREMYELKLDK